MLRTTLVLIVYAGASSAQTSPGVVCPLSEAQVHDSIEAFAKIVPTLKGEPRCVNCHGGLDIFSAESIHPDVIRATEDSPGTDCDVCHDHMEPRTNGEKSFWSLAPEFLGFVGKTDTQLCKQIKDFSDGPCSGGSCYKWPSAEKFIGHVTDDEGRDNFTATAFVGMRGLDPASNDVVPEPPRGITHEQLKAAGKAWVDTTGGEWQGKEDCGCELSHYALRLKVVTQISDQGISFRNEMGPIDVPIEFKDDGTFTGEAQLGSRGAGAADDCSLAASGGLNLKVSGKAVQKWNEHFLHVEFKPAGPTTMAGNVRCPEISLGKTITGTSDETYSADLVGEIGETGSIPMPGPDPAVRNTATVEIVKRE